MLHGPHIEWVAVPQAARPSIHNHNRAACEWSLLQQLMSGALRRSPRAILRASLGTFAAFTETDARGPPDCCTEWDDASTKRARCGEWDAGARHAARDITCSCPATWRTGSCIASGLYRLASSQGRHRCTCGRGRPAGAAEVYPRRQPMAPKVWRCRHVALGFHRPRRARANDAAPLGRVGNHDAAPRAPIQTSGAHRTVRVALDNRMLRRTCGRRSQWPCAHTTEYLSSLMGDPDSGPARSNA